MCQDPDRPIAHETHEEVGKELGCRQSDLCQPAGGADEGEGVECLDTNGDQGAGLRSKTWDQPEIQAER